MTINLHILFSFKSCFMPRSARLEHLSGHWVSTGFQAAVEKTARFPSLPIRWGKKALEESLPAKTWTGRDQTEEKHWYKGSEVISVHLGGMCAKIFQGWKLFPESFLENTKLGVCKMCFSTWRSYQLPKQNRNTHRHREQTSGVTSGESKYGDRGRVLRDTNYYV